MCIDYRELDKLTTKNLPRIDDLFDQLHGSCYFSKRDLHSGYHQLREHEEDILKTTLGRDMDTLSLRLCLFGLDNFFIVVIDDIMIYSKSKDDHEAHLKLVLELRKTKKLFAEFSMYEFWLQEVRFLRHVVNNNDIHVVFSKIEAMKN
uniref:Putative reverse transcriptase domain-containing protein n=1 Tax=Tanacetum cinerariifolium TaxID=118510 RepID=A0A6L2MRV8_TANCI|nr:putative reverse transcriptase domain-containing protein [Tanacetum cinerariifolium]